MTNIAIVKAEAMGKQARKNGKKRNFIEESTAFRK